MNMLFPVGIPATAEDLVNRQEEILSISTMLSRGENIVLISPRRYGKTSLALEIVNRLKRNGCYVEYIDIFTIIDRRDLAEQIVEKILYYKKIRNFAKFIKEKFSQLLRTVEFKQIIKDYEFILNFKEPHYDEWQLLKEAIDLPERIAQKDKKRAIIVFDEFGDLEKLDGLKLLKLMRGIIQLHRNTSYLFTGSQESIMTKLFFSPKQPFFKFAILKKLDVLPEPETASYIKKKFSQEKIDIKDSEISLILHKTKCHPYYTQLLCHCLYFRIFATKQAINKDDIEKAYVDALIHEKDFFEHLWLDLSTKKYYCDVLRKLIVSNKSIYSIEELKNINISRVLRDLRNKGIIDKINERYDIKDPFFKEYLLRRLDGRIL